MSHFYYHKRVNQLKTSHFLVLKIIYNRKKRLSVKKKYIHDTFSLFSNFISVLNSFGYQNQRKEKCIDILFHNHKDFMTKYH